MPPQPKANWSLVEVEYITASPPVSLEDLAKKYSVSEATIFRKSGKGDWIAKRKVYERNLAQKVQDDTLEHAAATISAERERMIKYIDAVLQTGITQLVGRKDPKNPDEWLVKPKTNVDARSILEAAKLKLVLLGETVDRSDMKGNIDHVFRVIYGERDEGKTHGTVDAGTPDSSTTPTPQAD